MLKSLLSLGLYLILSIGIVIVPVKLTHYLCKVKKIKINRWVIGCVGPLILIIPKLLFAQMPDFIWKILIFIFITSVIMFFELSRMMIENKEMKGLIDYSKYIKPNKRKVK
ncbi:hypothetical protein UT300007_32510 [Clostridium sp. CTA-7]